MLNAERASANGTNVGPPKPPILTSLGEIRKHLRCLAKRHDAAAYKLAAAACELADNWGMYRDEAGCEVGPWLSTNVRPSRHLDWYRSIVAAHDRAGTHAYRMSAEVARYLHNKISNDDHYRSSLAVISRKFVENGRCAVTMNQIPALLSELKLKGHSSLAKPGELSRLRNENKILSERVQRLEAQIRGLGAEPVM